MTIAEISRALASGNRLLTPDRAQEYARRILEAEQLDDLIQFSQLINEALGLPEDISWPIRP